MCSEQVPIDYTVTLTAHPAGTDVFDGWSGGGCSGTSASCTVSMSAAATVTATFSSTHLLSLGVGIPSAGGVITLSADVTVQPGNFNQHLTTGDYSYSLPFTDGTVVTITVTPNSLVPVLWGGACAGTSGDTCTITMNSDQTATASLNVS